MGLSAFGPHRGGDALHVQRHVRHTWRDAQPRFRTLNLERSIFPIPHHLTPRLDPFAISSIGGVDCLPNYLDPDFVLYNRFKLSICLPTTFSCDPLVSRSFSPIPIHSPPKPYV